MRRRGRLRGHLGRLWRLQRPGAIYECGCAPIPKGDCDCDGNQLDEVGVCGGECTLDLDMDGICDDVDTCLGNLDECGICNGPGAVYQCGCDFLPLGDCDCEGNQVDALGVCGGGCEADANCNGVCDDEEVLGCMDMMACNFHPTPPGRRQLHLLHLRRRRAVRVHLDRGGASCSE